METKHTVDDPSGRELRDELVHNRNSPVLNLGCPKFCEGFLCIDKFPHDSRVVEADVYEYLRICVDKGTKYESIFAKNLLEHLGNPLEFLQLCRKILKDGGILRLITDNAEFYPYYIPVAIARTGIGGHSTNSYALGMNQSVHLALFTKMHLKNLFAVAGFETVSIRRMPKVLFARLEAVGIVGKSLRKSL